MSASLITTIKQARSQKTLESILDATEALLIETDYSELSFRLIARTAGVTTGVIYTRVENKAALLDVLFNRYSEKVRKDSILYILRARIPWHDLHEH